GLWHGAGWTFLAWGGWHGGLLVLHEAMPGWRRLPAFWQRNLTVLLVTIGWVFFRVPSFAGARHWLAALVGVHGLGRPGGPGRAGSFTREGLALAALVALCLVIVRACPNSLELPLERLGALPQIGLAVASAASILLMNYGSRFLYFQF